jgi:hypothetical protein
VPTFFKRHTLVNLAPGVKVVPSWMVTSATNSAALHGSGIAVEVGVGVGVFVGVAVGVAVGSGVSVGDGIGEDVGGRFVGCKSSYINEVSTT